MIPTNQIVGWLNNSGISVPTRYDLIEAAIAAGFLLIAIAVGSVAGRRVGPPLTEFWKRSVAHTGEGVWTRLDPIVQYTTSALILAVVTIVYDWQPLAGLVLGTALGLFAALAATQVLRGLGIPRWLAWTIATVIFVSLLSNAIGGLEPITNVLQRIGFSVGKRRFSLMTLVRVLVTVTILFALMRLINRFVDHWISRTKVFDPTQKILAQKLAGVIIIVVAFFFGIDLLGIDLTTFAVFGGALGLAVGFGLQKTVGNLIAGIILLMDRSIKPGDVIVVGDSFGWVNKIGVRAVSVVTRDGKEHLIPNENLMTQEVENWSYSSRDVRVRIPVGVAYESDLGLAQKLMLRAATESPRVLDSPRPNIWLTEFGDFSVNHEILVWISDPEGGVGNVRSDVLNRLWRLFKENGIEIPFPQSDVRVKSWPKADQVPANLSGTQEADSSDAV